MHDINLKEYIKPKPDPVNKIIGTFNGTGNLKVVDFTKDVTKIIVDGIEQPVSTSININTTGEHTFECVFKDDITDAYYLFYGCNFSSLDLSNFKINNTINTYGLFYSCNELTSLNLSNFDTSNVTNMSEMFYNCDGLTSLDLSNFNTSNVTNMSKMFSNCNGLASLNLSNFNTSNVTNMSKMFYDCSNLSSLDLTNFDTSNVTDMSQMFFYCYIKELKMGGKIKTDVNTNSMFSGAGYLKNFYYNSEYDYSLILSQLSSSCAKIPCTMVNGVLVPN